jgi:hypothetical protein
MNPAGVLLDEAQGKVGWVDEQTARLYWVTAGFVPMGSLDLTAAGATAPRGADRDPTSTHLFTDDPSGGLIRTDSSGLLLEATPWSNLGVLDPGGVGLSPAEGLLLTVDRASHTLMEVNLGSYFLAEVKGLDFSDDAHLLWNRTSFSPAIACCEVSSPISRRALTAPASGKVRPLPHRSRRSRWRERAGSIWSPGKT